MSEDLTISHFTGRFYRPVSPIEKRKALENATRMAWSPPNIYPAFLRGFCQGSPPHGGNIEEDALELAYEDGPMVRMFLREEERSANRNTIQIEADRLSRERHGHALKDLPKGSKKEIEGEAKASLIAKALPKTRVRTIVMTDKFLWLSGRQSSAGEETFLARVFGDVVIDTDLVFGGSGAKEAMLALILEGTSHEGMAAPHVRVIDATVKNRTMRCRGEEVKVLEAMLGTGAVHVERVELEVDLGSSRVNLAVDERGVVKVEPAPSMGGVYLERVQRRFNEAREAAGMIGEVVKKLTS